MKNSVVLLLDYLGRFSSKWAAKPYRSGMDVDRLEAAFNGFGYQIERLHYSDVDLRSRDFRGEHVLYTSSEDHDLRYKSYVEDIVYALERQGANLLPPYPFLRAHHNKVFMELMRDLSPNEGIKNIRSRHYGTKEDYFRMKHSYPEVIKGAAGAVSTSVYRIDSASEANGIVSKVSRSNAARQELHDRVRALRHSGYRPESRYRNKFVTQNYVSGMSNDWKVIVFGAKYFILERTPKKNDFRASGSGIIHYPEIIPDGLLDYAENVYRGFSVPFLAMDVGFDGEQFCLIEFQAVYFGTHTVDTAPYYMVRDSGEWRRINASVVVEEEMALSVSEYLRSISNEER